MPPPKPSPSSSARYEPEAAWIRSGAPAAELRVEAPAPPPGRRCAAPGGPRVWTKSGITSCAYETRAEPETHRVGSSVYPAGAMATSSHARRPGAGAARGGSRRRRGGVRPPARALPRASSTRTATACSARCTTPRTRSRTPSLRAWRGLAGSRAAARSARGSTRSPRTRRLNLIARRPKRVLPLDYGPADRPARRPRACRRLESVWVEPYPDEGARPRGRPRRARGPLRAARERRAGVRRGAPAPAGQPARRADPARGARASPRSEMAESLDTTRRLREQRAPARAQDGRRAAAGAEPAGHAARARRRSARASSSRATWTRCSAATWTPSCRCSPRTPPGRCRRSRPGSAATRRSAGFLRFGPLSGDWRWRHVPTRANGQPAVGSYAWYEPDGCYRPFALDVLTLDGDRIGRDHLVHHALHARAASSTPTCATRSSRSRTRRSRGRSRPPGCPSDSTEPMSSGPRAGLIRDPNERSHCVRQHEGIQRLRRRRPGARPASSTARRSGSRRRTDRRTTLTLHLAGNRPTLVYPKPDFTPATYTILNFLVDDIERPWTTWPSAA